MVKKLYRRDIGRIRSISRQLPSTVEKRIENEFSKTVSSVNCLKQALESRSEMEIEYVVGDILANFLEGLSHASTGGNTREAARKSMIKKQQRELFVSLGGMDLLLKLISPPFVPADARSIAKERVSRQSDLWNEILVIFREMITSVPSLPDLFFATHHVVFLFTLLSHSSVFDNTMNALEELLAVREDTFSLASIPRFYSLIRGLSARQLAHFCRVLSLVVFEPEDRQIMEGTQVIRSTELLHLRRQRMSRSSIGMVERNQNLIIEMPELLPRLVQILRVINYGPSLYDLISHNIMTQIPITSDILTFLSTAAGISDWDHFRSLENVAQPLSYSDNSRGATTDDEFSTELLNAFSPTNPDSSRSLDLANLANVIQVAQRLGIANITPLGHALLLAQPLINETYSGNNNNSNNSNSSNNSSSTPTTPTAGSMSTRSAQRTGRSASDASGRSGHASRARNELRFHSMLLSPHQIELVFVICTLLSGRRKVAVQKKLAELGLGEVLSIMFDRMSWNAPPMTGPNPLEHVHGPNCECSPESAIRVQFLRLVHNFYDRDFLGNPNKLLVMSETEKQFILKGVTSPHSKEASSSPDRLPGRYQRQEVQNLLSEVATEYNLSQSSTAIANPLELNNIDKGLLTKIALTLCKEKPDSAYRFWLSACLENCLRGGGPTTQLLLAKTGVFHHTIQHILSCSSKLHSRKKEHDENSLANVGNTSLISSLQGKYSSDPDPMTTNSSTTEAKEDASNSLQTSYDLLGELIKGNPELLEHLETYLTHEQLRSFLMGTMSHLVESNVFLRSLYLTLEVMNTTYGFESVAINQNSSSLVVVSSSDTKGKKSNRASLALDPDYFGFSLNALAAGEPLYLMGYKKGYLIDTWIQFTCRPLDPRTNDVFLNSEYYQDEKRKLRNNNSHHQSQNASRFLMNTNLFSKSSSPSQHSQSNSNNNTLSSLSSAMKDIRKATTHFLKFGDGAATNLPPPAPSTQSSSSWNTSASTMNRSSFRSPNRSTFHGLGHSNIVRSEIEILDSLAQVDPKCEEITATNVDIIGVSDNTVIQQNHPSVTTTPPQLELMDDLFYTPPEGPKFRRGSRSLFSHHPNNNSSNNSSHQNMTVMDTFTNPLVTPPMESKEQAGFDETIVTTRVSTATPPIKSTEAKRQNKDSDEAAPFEVTCQQLPRISLFFLQEKYTILLRLITTISLKTINHENICCLNSALLILLLDYQRGQLGKTLLILRDLANRQYIYEQHLSEIDEDDENDDITTLKISESIIFGNSNSSPSTTRSSLLPKKLHNRATCTYCAIPTYPMNSFIYPTIPKYCYDCGDDNNAGEDIMEEDENVNDSEKAPSVPYSKKPNERKKSPRLTGGEIVMKNFRELLWYWREYYLRRGRDRLSIEFSSHIPFRFWNHLVDTLCADNGSETALLSRSISVPTSPYQKSLQHLYLSKGCEIGTLVNL